jgi:hypothetical protein
MSSFLPLAPTPDQGLLDLAKVQRVNQSWIVHGRLRENAAAWLEHLRLEDPRRLEKSCWLALFLTRYKKSVLRDPKPLFYAGLFAFATTGEIETYLADHPLTRAISLLGQGERRGLDPLPPSARDLAEGIATEIRQILEMA